MQALKRWVIIDLDIVGIPDRILLSNREYHPDAGPNAGKHYRAAWTRASYQGWKMTKVGLAADGNLTRTTGVAAYQPGDIEISNARPTPNAAREFSALLDLPEFSGTYTIRIAEGKNDGTQPEWADFQPFGAGILRRKPRRVDRGKRIALRFEPTQDLLASPLLSQRFTGYGAFFRSELTTTSSTAPAVMGGSFTLQSYGTMVWDEVVPLDPVVYLYRLRTAANGTLLSLYLVAPTVGGDFEFFAEVLTTSGILTYSLGVVTAVTKNSDAVRLDEVVFSWDEDNLRVRAWIAGAATLDVAMAAVSAGAGTENHFQMFVTRAANPIYMSSLRVFDFAVTETSDPLRLEDVRGPLAYPEETLISGYEFNRRTGLDLVDDGVAGIDLVSSGGFWGSITEGVDGAKALAGFVIPAAFGQPFNVPVVLFDRRDDIGAAVAAGEVRRLYVNGVGLTKTLNYTADVIVDGNRGTMRGDTGGTVPVDFADGFLPGQWVDISMPGLVGTFKIAEISPDPYSRVRETTSAPPPQLVIVFEGLPAGTFTGSATVTSNTAAWVASGTVNPYHPADVEMPVIAYLGAFPTNATADLLGDPKILAAGPPSETFVDPGDPANVVAQMLSRYAIQWDSSLFTVPSYGAIPGSVGYFVNDDRPAADAVAEVLAGYNAWLDEGLDGISVLRQLTLDSAAADHIIPEGSIIDVSTPGRSSSDGAEGVPGLEVRYRRAWVKQDSAAIPEAADDDLAAFVTQGYQKVVVGSPVGANPPVFETFEIDRRRSRRLGDVALALSQSDPVNIRFRQLPGVAALYQFSEIVECDAPLFDLPAFIGKICGVDITAAAGTVTLTLVEVAP